VTLQLYDSRDKAHRPARSIKGKSPNRPGNTACTTAAAVWGTANAGKRQIPDL